MKNTNLYYQLGDTVQLMDGSFWLIDEVLSLKNSTMYRLKQTVNNIDIYKCYSEAKMFSNAFVVNFSENVNDLAEHLSKGKQNAKIYNFKDYVKKTS